MIQQQLQQDMVTALKAKEEKKLMVLRGLIAQIKNVEIDKHAPLSDEEVVAVVRKQIKTTSEAKAMFEKGGRADLVSENEAELKILSAYVPAQMSDSELGKKVQAVVEAHAEVTNIGQLIGLAVRELKGVAESSRIAELVKKYKA